MQVQKGGKRRREKEGLLQEAECGGGWVAAAAMKDRHHSKLQHK
jgi:hypothetical protein